MSRRRRPGRAAAVFVALAIAGVAAGAAVAAFGTTSASAGNVFSQAPDWAAPATGASVVAKAAGARRATSARAGPSTSTPRSPTPATRRAP